MPKKKILMPMMEAGAGHKMPALAVKESIEALYPGKYQIDVIDFAKECGALGNDRTLKGIWDWALAHPFWAKAGYIASEVVYPLSMLILPWLNRDWVAKGRQYIEKYQPDIIFSTHFFSISVAARARQALKAKFKVIGFVTDPFDGYSFWCERRADILIGASDTARRRLLRHGMKRERLKVFPFPIKKAFFHLPRHRDEIKKQYALDPDMPTILTTAGGQGISRISQYVIDMYKKGLPFNIISVCGHNEELRLELEQLTRDQASKTHLVPLGFVSNMNELLSVSDLCIAKAGASTTFEALLMNTPIIFTDWATYSEKPNVDYTVRNQVGWWAGNDKAFYKIIHDIQHTDILKQYHENLKGLSLQTGADEIARYVVEQLEGK